jgi:hypothetical protein
MSLALSPVFFQIGPITTPGFLACKVGDTPSCKKMATNANVKGKIHSITGHEDPEREYMYSYTLSLTSALDVGEWSKPHPGHFTPGKGPVPIVYQGGWGGPQGWS